MKFQYSTVGINVIELHFQLFLLTAAKNGDIRKVQSLLENKRTDINYQSDPVSSTYTTCADHHCDQ